eukprot:746653-Rhodomonas_salina.1
MLPSAGSHCRDFVTWDAVEQPISSYASTHPRMAFAFVLTDRQGFVFVDVDTKVIYLFSHEARVEMKIPLWDISDMIEEEDDSEGVKLLFGLSESVARIRSVMICSVQTRIVCYAPQARPHARWRRGTEDESRYEIVEYACDIF